MPRVRSRERGLALVTALLFSVFMLLVGLFFLISLRRDFDFQTRTDASLQAYYLALSGIDYYRTQPIDHSQPHPFDHPAFDQTNPARIQLDARLSFTVYGMDASDPGVVLDAGAYDERVGELVGTTIVSRGEVRDGSGSLLAERTLVVPQGLMTNVYEN